MFNKYNIAATVLFASLTGIAGAQTVVQSWVDRYDGAGQGVDGTDRGFAVAIDGQGNTIVGGFSAENQGGSYLAIKYAPDGTILWDRTSTTVSGGIGRAMTLDQADDVIVVGSADVGALFGVVKYDTGGHELWSATYDPGPGFLSSYEGVATDATGAVYAYGNHWPSSSSPWSIILVKYAADGTFLWDLEYSPARAEEIAVTDDAVYLVGNSEVASNDEDLLVLKVTPTGSIAWARTYGRTGLFANDSAMDMAIDASGNVVAAGSYSGNAGFPEVTTDYAVVRVAPDGTTVSEVVYDGPDGVWDEGRTLVLDTAGNAIVSGRMDGPGGGFDVLTVKLDPVGNEVWTRIYGGLETYTDTPNDMAIDAFGNVYIVGETVSPGLITEYFTIKYDPAGTLQWEQRYGGTTYDPSHGMAVAVAADQRVVVTGYSAGLGPFGDDDVATVCYTQQSVVGDLNGDNAVDSADLALLLGNWGPCPGCPADLDGDGAVDAADLALLLGNWSIS